MKAIKLTKQAHERRQAARAKRKPLDIDALVVEAVPPRPNLQLAFTIPVRVDSETNAWEYWAEKSKRKRKQKEMIRVEWPRNGGLQRSVSLPCIVRFIRVGQKRLDDDNLRDAFKAVRDAVATIIGVDDGDERIKWEYEQVAVGRRVYAVRVEIY